MTPFEAFAVRCSEGQGAISIGFPTWYKYLDCDQATNTPQLNQLSDAWLVGQAVLEMLIFIAGIAAVFYFIYGGIRFITSQGQPDKITQARQILIYSAVGLVVAVMASVLVQFVFSQFGVEAPTV
jgi:hypothetical protein